MSAAHLHVSDERGRRVVTVDRPLFVIGRRTTADLQLNSTDVSREHAEILHDGGRYRLRDRGSRFGTFVNGDQVSEHTLTSGDTIRLGRSGGVELVFMVDGESSALRSSASEVGDLRQMAAIVNGLRALGSGRVLDEVLTMVMDSAIDVTKADRGFVMLADTAGALEFKIARARGRLALGDVLRDQREDSARGVLHRAQPRRGRPARRRRRRRAWRHDRRGHSTRAVRAAASLGAGPWIVARGCGTIRHDVLRRHHA